MSKRSVKIDGVTTSLFLEDAFWQELEQRARERDITWTQYLRSLIEENDTSGNRSAAVKEILLSKLRQELDTLRNNKITTNQSYWLVEQRGIRDRVGFEKSTIAVGRDPNNDIVLHDPEVAEKHLLLSFDNQRWWAIDLNTKQGSRLNNKPVSTALIPRRGEITIGSSQIIRV
jgi:predicted DNA-binding ribbon-helix-helix protein